jgi:hypothetical protein
MLAALDAAIKPESKSDRIRWNIMIVTGLACWS